MNETLLWEASEEKKADSNLQAYINYINRNKLKLSPISNYQELHQWSINHRAEFWQSLWDFFQIKSTVDADTTLKNPKLFPGSIWFEGAKLNFADNLLSKDDDSIAITEYDENGFKQSLSYKELEKKVRKCSNYLRSIGVKKGDRVVAYLPNTSETIIAMLASSSVGAIFSSCSPDFGSAGVCDRFSQLEPKVLFTTRRFLYAGKSIDNIETINEICEQLTSIEKLVIVDCSADELSEFSKAQALESIYADQGVDGFHFEQLAFNDPLYILFSSGTTGLPKCIMHSVGGTLIQHLKEHQLHCNINEGDKVFYYTTCGWMMWNWLASALASKATLVLFNGSPFHPKREFLLDLIDIENIKVFGISAKYLSAIEKEGLVPKRSHKLTSLETILSTGSPLSPESFDYVYNNIKEDLCLSSIAGGTDIISCFVLGNPILPVYKGRIQCKGLGMDVDVLDQEQLSISNEKGELVCKQSFPSCPIGFWNDPENKKFLNAYFSTIDNIWVHGDFAEQDENGSFVIHGRSDAVLNPGGVRIGTAEIYRQVEKIEQILESLVIGQSYNHDTRVVLFVKLRPDIELDDSILQRIKTEIRENATPRHVPQLVLAVKDIPRTKSGKIVELAVRDIVHGREVKNKEALENPEALEYFKNLPELQ